MHILFVTAYPPSRIRVRSYELLKQLHREHEVIVVTQCSSEQEYADVQALRECGLEVVVVWESRRRAALRSGLALVGPSPLQAAYARSARLEHTIRNLVAERPIDIVHVEHIRGIASMEPLLRTLPIVWDSVDCISLLFKQTMLAGPAFSVRALARIEYKRTQRYETKMLSALSHVVVTSERDRQALLALQQQSQPPLTRHDDVSSSNGTIHVLPNGVDLAYFHPLQEERRRYNLVFSGKMSYHANVATALYLRYQIMPLIWRQRPAATLTIAGSKPPKIVRDLASDPRVEVTGYVEDIRSYIGKAEIMLSPMVYSVGIQNKVLEAMALGTPVIVAAQAAETLGTLAGRDLLIATSAREFADAALLLMDDAELRATLSREGRRYVEQHHDWRVVADQLHGIYEQAAANFAQRTQGSRTSTPTPGRLARAKQQKSGEGG